MTKSIRRKHRNLKAWREAHGFSQYQAARYFGVSQSFWSKVELGIRHPRPARAKQLMKETGVSLEVLMGIAS